MKPDENNEIKNYYRNNIEEIKKIDDEKTIQIIKGKLKEIQKIIEEEEKKFEEKEKNYKNEMKKRQNNLNIISMRINDDKKQIQTYEQRINEKEN